MSIRNGWPAVSGAADQFDIRSALRATIAQDANGGIKTGAAITTTSLTALVTPRQDMAVDLQPSDWVLDRHGPVFLSVDGTETIQLDPAPSANSRIDTIWVKQQETQSPIGDTTDGPIAGRTTGVPSINPTPPAIPEGALAVADILIPSTATNTSSPGVIITQRYPYTASAGGFLRFRTSVEMNAWDAPDGYRAILDDGSEYKRSGGKWVPINPSQLIEGIAGGIKATAIPAAGMWSKDITFDTPFEKPPYVWTDGGDVVFNTAARNITRTGFQFWLINVSSNPNSADVFPRWYAYGTIS